MNKEHKSKHKRRWLRRITGVLLALAVLLVSIVCVGIVGLEIGWFDAPMHDAIVGQIEKVTGGRVELTRFHFSPFTLRAELTGLTVHGLEPEGTPPLFHADYVLTTIQVDSFWHKKISLRDLRIIRPAVHVRFNADGTSNVPAPRTPQNNKTPLRERLFEFAIRHLEFDDGTILYNDVRAPLVAEGNNFDLSLDWGMAHGAPLYLGNLSWQQFTFAAQRFLPFAADLSMKFTFAADSFHVEQLQLKLPNSHFDVQADFDHLAAPEISYRWRGWLDFTDIREILRKPQTPRGLVDFSGEGRVVRGDWRADGRYSARDIALPYEWFHSGGITSRGTFHIARGQLVVPDFEAGALGGVIQGRVTMLFKGSLFNVESHGNGLSLATVLSALANKSFPVETFHWDSAMRVDCVTTWTLDFKHLESRGTSDWSAPSPGAPKQLAPGKIPVTAHLDYDYVMDQKAVTIRASEIQTPTSRITFAGTLGATDSGLDVGLDVRDILPWNDFINTLRGVKVQPVRIAGRATWQGKLTGELADPTFSGHTHLFDASYGSLYWDEAEGDLTYSSKGFELAQARARRGKSSAQIEIALPLDEWALRPDAAWRFDADVANTPVDGLQQMFGWSFPAKGLLSGEFHLKGTPANPEFTGLFDMAELDAWGLHIDRARGQIVLDHDEIRIANGEVRLNPPGGSGTRGPSLLTGNFAYRFADATVNFDLTGAVIPIENIQEIQTPRLPLGGELSFQLKGSGPLRAPVTQGTLRIVNLLAAHDDLGSFEGKLDADGKRVRVELSSALPADRLRGHVEMAFSGDLPLYGELDVKEMDPDPLIRAGMHLEGITGHSSMDGHLVLTGAAMNPDSISVDADLSRLALDYDFVKLENNGPVKFTYKRNEVRVEQADLRGTDTDLHISGFARMMGDRALGLNMLGSINLRLLGGLVQGLDVRGAANINAAIGGTLPEPRINGRLDVTDASASYDDFPAGLSKVTGGFVFDASRLQFENVHAQIGGGDLTLGGSVSYGDGFNAMHYDMTARANNVRIRYPEGMSWLSSGTLRLAGGMQAALLSGSITVQRLLMSENFDLASLLVSSNAPVRAPTTSSPFLRNLQFDILAKSSPDARVEWISTSFESEADLRVRGTWENPILLGRISLLNGDLSFAGNRYRLTRGDIDFTNPFRLDPIINVQASTTIQQYEVTLDISGPASRLALNYRSDPPLPSSDIINLLALGQATESTAYRSTTAAQTPQSGATSLLTEAISNQLGGRLERLFGITRFRVDPFLAGTTNAQNGAARVTIEEQVGKNLTVTYVTNVAGAQEEVIQVEYLVRPDVSIVALRDYNGTFSLDVVFKKRFK